MNRAVHLFYSFFINIQVSPNCTFLNVSLVKIISSNLSGFGILFCSFGDCSLVPKEDF